MQSLKLTVRRFLLICLLGCYPTLEAQKSNTILLHLSPAQPAPEDAQACFQRKPFKTEEQLGLSTLAWEIVGSVLGGWNL